PPRSRHQTRLRHRRRIRRHRQTRGHDAPMTPPDEIGLKFLQWLQRRWATLLLSLIFAVVAGSFVGPVLYWSAHCWSDGNDCYAYSPTKIFISYVLSWPILGLQFVAPQYSPDRTPNINPVSWDNPANLVLWAYYYALLSGMRTLLARMRKGPKK